MILIATQTTTICTPVSNHSSSILSIVILDHISCTNALYTVRKYRAKISDYTCEALHVEWRCIALISSFSHLLSGDPKADLAYERQYEQQTYHVIPEVIKNFLQYFHKTISDLIDQKVYELQSNRVSSESIEQKIYEIQDVYENR